MIKCDIYILHGYAWIECDITKPTVEILQRIPREGDEDGRKEERVGHLHRRAVPAQRRQQ